MVTAKEPDNEASYANCLLTTLGKVPPVGVTLHPRVGVPDLLRFAKDDDEREWIAGLPFKYAQLDGAKVIALVLTFAGYKPYHLRGRDYTLVTTLVTTKGAQEVRFKVRRGGGLPTGAITITRDDCGA